MHPDKIEKILLTQIDEPSDPVRSHFNEELLQDLADSIKTNGLIQPIVVKQKGDRFEVVAGHRRLQAYRLLRLPEIEAIVKDYTEDQAESAKVHENLFREDVNPVDQAVFLAKYIERTKSDLAGVARMLNRSMAWVADRLEILQYPDYMIEEVAQGKITLGVARWLSQIPNEQTKREYTRFASLGGINIRTARRWYEQSIGGTLPENPANLPPGQDYQTAPASAMRVRCAICQDMEELGNLESDFVHRACREQMVEGIAAAKAAQPPPLEEQVEIKPA